jgi:hypothetical protein
VDGVEVSAEELQQVNQIFQALDQLRDNAPHEKRLCPRYNFPTAHAMMVTSLPGKTHCKVFPRDISRSGIGFLSRRSFKVGELFVVVLSHTLGTERALLSRAVFCRYTSQSMYEIGAAFESTIVAPAGKSEIPPAWVERALAGTKRSSSSAA